jgi:anti-sigma factor RsiW
MNGEHLGEAAELYPLGALEPGERAAADAHLTTCAECRERVAAAEAAAAVLASALEAHEPPRSLRDRVLFSAQAATQGAGRQRRLRIPGWATAAAAALVLGVGALGWQDVSLRAERSASDEALSAVVHGHFNHVTLQKAHASSPVAKVLYARDGTWLFAIVDRPASELRLYAKDASGGAQEVGRFQTDGALSTIFVRNPGPFVAIELRDGSGTQGSAIVSPGG